MTRDDWDREAVAFDLVADHGLRSPEVRHAWKELLLSVLPPSPARVADLGCGTGSLTRLLTDEGYSVDGLDFSPAMIKQAIAKVPEARFVVGDASSPDLPQQGYHVILSRHVLWAMPDPFKAFDAWVSLLAPGGIAALIEGNWSTGAGLTVEQTTRIVLGVRGHIEVTDLSHSIYWGKEVCDERYMAVTRR